MFFSIFYLIIIFISSIGYGNLLHKILFKNIRYSNFGELGFLGLISLSFLSTFFHLFLKIDINFNVIIYLLGLFLFFYFLKKKFFIFQKNYKYLFISIILLAVFMLAYHKPNEDFGYYHLPYLINFTSEKVIFGLSTIHTNQGWNSMWLNLMATYKLPVISINGFHLANLIFFIFFSIIFCFELLNFKSSISNSNNLIKFFCLNFYLYFLLKFSRLNTYGFDVPSNFIAVYCFYLLLIYFNLEKKNFEKKNYIFNKIILFSFFSATIKLSNALICLLPIFLFFKKETILFSRSFLFFLFFLFIWVVQQFIYTGCFLFPLIYSCLNVDWFNAGSVFDLLNHTGGINKSFAQYKGVLTEAEYIKNFNWVSTWFNRTKVEIFEHFFSFIVIFIFSLFIFIFSKKKIKNIFDYSFYKIILFILTFQILFWFLSSPVLRFGFHYVLLFIFFLLTFFLRNILLKKSNYFFIVFLIILGFLINLNKNFYRIFTEMKNNATFFYSYPKVFYETNIIENKNINLNYLLKDKSIYCWDVPSICIPGDKNINIDRVNGYIVVIKK